MKILFAFIFAALLTACGGGDEDEFFDVHYEVTGTTDRANWTIAYFDGSVGQYTLPVPYKTSPLLFRKGDFVYLSAQNDRSSGSVTATIWVNGSRWKQVTSSGAYVIATVSGSL